MKTLTKKQIQDLQDDLIATMPTYTHFKIDDLCNMALRYLEVLDVEPVQRNNLGQPLIVAPTMDQIEHENTPTECGGTFIAPSASLSREQIDKIHKNTAKATGELDCLPDEFDQLCRLALIGRQCLDAEPVAWESVAGVTQVKPDEPENKFYIPLISKPRAK